MSTRSKRPFYADESPWALGIGGVALVLLVLFGSSPKEVARLRSPNGNAEALLMRIPPGEFDHSSDYEIVVVATGERPPFGAPIMHWNSVAVRLDDPKSSPFGDLALRWTGPAQLTVFYGTVSRLVMNQPVVHVGAEDIAVKALAQPALGMEADLFVYPSRPQ